MQFLARSLEDLLDRSSFGSCQLSSYYLIQYFFHTPRLIDLVFFAFSILHLIGILNLNLWMISRKLIMSRIQTWLTMGICSMWCHLFWQLVISFSKTLNSERDSKTEEISTIDPVKYGGHHWVALPLENQSIITTTQQKKEKVTKSGSRLHFDHFSLLQIKIRLQNLLHHSVLKLI